ncbi:MAG: TonB-dependent receptor [Acidobacteria bacterium]|nr:TonB-dependent receptor [Acidobacteriota bacterium]
MVHLGRRFGGWLLALSVALLLSALTPLHAQPGSATLTGIVLDPDGNAIPNAAVVLRSDATGFVRAISTDGTGRFSVDGIPAGAYVVEVTASGFIQTRRANVQLVAGKTENVSVALAVAGVSEAVTVSAALPAAAQTAVSQGSLTARSAQSMISGEFIQNFTSPIADYSQVIQMAPGTFSVSPNGVGLGDTKTFFRGFKDGYYSMTFDGLPFNDTNDPTHHSWAFFPAQFLGATVFDRSPGSASSIGPSTFGGSVNLMSRTPGSAPRTNLSASFGSYSTKLFDVDFDSGTFGPDGRSRFLLDAHEMNSDGYQTFNFQKRDAVSGKYQYSLSDHTVLTAFGSYIDVKSNTPNQKGATRAQVAQFGDNFLMTGDPSSPLYYGYNFYHIPTDFEYVGVKSNLGSGWSFEDKVYTLSYDNKQNYNSLTAISTTSATDKLNSYRKYGNLAPLSQVSPYGVFRTGLWSELAYTDRYQAPSDPRTWVDAALPNFHEKFTTTTLQPYAEYELRVTQNLRITPGLKLAYYKQDFTQFADNGKTVGNLGGAASVSHAATYTSWLPSLDAHYMLKSNWSAYAQYGKGQNIPPTSVFDVKNAAVQTLPNPTLTDTYQAGTVYKSGRLALDVDVYRINFENDYSSTIDQVSGEPVYYVSGTEVTKGIEAESTILVGGGLSLYLNGTTGSARYTDTGLWSQNAPEDTETVGLNLQRANWGIGFYNKRIGTMFNDNGDTHEAVPIDPFNITNLFVNYTLRGSTPFSQSKVRLSVNNLFDRHYITGVNPAGTKTSAPAPGDVLTIMAGRSVSLTFTVGFSPRP